MEPVTTGDLKRYAEKMPGIVKLLATVLASVVIPLCLGLIAFGEIKGAQKEAARFHEQELAHVKAHVAELQRLRELDNREHANAIMVVQNALGELRTVNARICVRVRCRE